MTCRTILALLLTAAAACGAEPAPRPEFAGRGYDVPTSLTVTGLACRARVTGDEYVRDTYAPRPVYRRYEVTHVYFGDAHRKHFYLESHSDAYDYRTRKWIRHPCTDRVPVEAGREFIFLLSGSTRDMRPVLILPDTPENRKAVEGALTPHLRKIRGELNFRHTGRYLDAAEKLLRSFLDEVAREFPDHPHLGPAAVRKLRVCRRQQHPPGVYVRIEAGLSQVKIDGRPVTRPQGKQGVEFWAGVGTSDGFNTTRWSWDAPQSRSSNYCPSFYIRTAEQNAQNWRKVIRAWNRVRTLEKEFREDQPQDVEMAIACLKDFAGRRRPRPVKPGPIADIPAWQETARCGRAYYAYLALRHEAEKKRISDAEKRRLIPLLISMLDDGRWVRNDMPCDGNVTRSLDMAYGLLLRLSGQRFPKPVQTPPPSGGRGAVPRQRDPAEAPDDSPQSVARRLAKWRHWWTEMGSDPIKQPNDSKP
jgi:hypothetical protein